jgi:signal transduction histidine kinase
MSDDSRSQAPERNETDESLHGERKRADLELGRQHASMEMDLDAVVRQAREDADEVLEKARGHADEVLEKARERADETLERDASGRRQTLDQERAQEDATVEQDRLTADETLTDERQERTRALTNLLRLEREQTDERLLIERARGDADLALRVDFMGMVAHDLRTLLGAIALAAEVQFRSATGDDEAGRRVLDAAAKTQRLVARMNRLIGDLVDVVSIEGGRFAIAPTSYDAKALIREIVETFRPTASAKGISLNATTEGSLLVRLDHERIFQVLTNLLSNAIKFTDQHGTISVRVAPEGSEVRFSVADTGAGIAADQLEPIFERFWQVSQGDRRGLGLGLFISRCIVEAHGGRIWTESEVGKGSTFFFVLPGAAPS